MLDIIVCKLWYGRFRRPFRAVLRRVFGRRERRRILLGPLRGCWFIDDGWLSPHSLGIYELHIQYTILRTLKKGNVFYDIGANNGFLSLLAAKIVGDEGHVYAFEPLPENTQKLLQIMLENNIKNCTLLPYAVSDKQGIAKFFLGDTNSTSSLIQGSRVHSITVNTITLDEFARENCKPKLIKVDVEGTEYLVLKGAYNLLSDKNAPSWIIEVHDENNDRLIIELLRLYGYKIQKVTPLYYQQRYYPYHIYAWK